MTLNLARHGLLNQLMVMFLLGMVTAAVVQAVAVATTGELASTTVTLLACTTMGAILPMTSRSNR